MSTTVSWNGSSYIVPATGETDWGGASHVDGLLISLGQNALSKAGGTFAITNEIDFFSGAGLKSIYYKSRGTNISTAGIVRLASAESIGWRNNANSGNLLLTTDASDDLLFNGAVISSSAGIAPVSAGGTGFGSYTIGDTLYASGTTTFSKLAIGTINTVSISTGSAPSWALIANANVSASAAIAFSKLASLTSAHILVGNVSNVAVDVAMSGDVTITNAGVTAIGAAKVTNAMLAGSITAANLVGTDIATVGTITTGVWHGTAIAAAFLVGSDITTVGTVTTGTWSATAIAAIKGGTGQTSFTTGDLLYASSSSAISKLGIGSTGQVLKVSGGLPAWTAFNATAPTVQKFTSSSGTYTTPAGVSFLRVRMTGAGGGSAGTAGGSAGGVGGDTTFGSSFLTAVGGGTPSGAAGGAGGTATIVGLTGIALVGGSGSGSSSVNNTAGGAGGNNSFGGAGGGGGAQLAGGAGATNSGAGGGGAGGNGSAGGGGGGGAGGYIDVIVTSPSATYAYAIGAAGAAGGSPGGAGANAGSAGGSGFVIVEEFYN